MDSSTIAWTRIGHEGQQSCVRIRMPLNFKKHGLSW
jgi:hypothetical protein